MSRARPYSRVTGKNWDLLPLRRTRPGHWMLTYTQQQWQDDFEDQPIRLLITCRRDGVVDAGVYLRGDGQGRRRAGLTQSQSARWATVSWIDQPLPVCVATARPEAARVTPARVRACKSAGGDAAVCRQPQHRYYDARPPNGSHPAQKNFPK